MLAKERDARPRDASSLEAELTAISERLDRTSRDSSGRSTSVVVRPARDTLTTGEQRVICVVLVTRPRPRQELPLPESPSSLTDSGVRAAEAKRVAETVVLPSNRAFDEADFEGLRATLVPYGARVDRLLDGSMVVTLAGRGAPTDQAAHAGALRAAPARDAARGGDDHQYRARGDLRPAPRRQRHRPRRRAAARRARRHDPSRPGHRRSAGHALRDRGRRRPALPARRARPRRRAAHAARQGHGMCGPRPRADAAGGDVRRVRGRAGRARGAGHCAGGRRQIAPAPRDRRAAAPRPPDLADPGRTRRRHRRRLAVRPGGACVARGGRYHRRRQRRVATAEGARTGDAASEYPARRPGSSWASWSASPSTRTRAPRCTPRAATRV